MFRTIELAPIRQPEATDIRRLMGLLHRELVGSARYDVAVAAGFGSARAGRSVRGFADGLVSVLGETLDQAGNLSQLVPAPGVFKPLDPDQFEVRPLARPIGERDVRLLLQRYQAAGDALFDMGRFGYYITESGYYVSGLSCAFRAGLQVVGQGVTAVRMDSHIIATADELFNFRWALATGKNPTS